MRLRAALYSLIIGVTRNFQGRTPGQPPHATAPQLRVLLRRHPQWSEGHLLLGEEALRIDDIGTAYASAHAVLQLERTTTTKIYYRARFLLGCCYLRNGDAVRAIEILKPLLTCKTFTFQVHEELAAAYMAIGDFEAAMYNLQCIPSERLSREGVAALRFVAAKIQ